jgi:hypothetical protein
LHSISSGLHSYILLLLLFGSITTAAVLGIIYSVFNSYQPLPEDFFKYGNYVLTFQVLMFFINNLMKFTLQLVLFSVWFETVLYLEELEYAMLCAHFYFHSTVKTLLQI